MKKPNTPAHTVAMPRIEMRRLSALRPHPKNPNKHPDSQIVGMGMSFDEFGVASVLVVDEHDLILAGHARVTTGLRKNMQALPAIVVEGWSDAKKLAFMISDNQHSKNAMLDPDILRENLEALQGAEISFESMGFDQAALAAALSKPNGGLTDPDDAPPTRDKPGVRLGDVWLLGKHRLLCGDSTKKESIQRIIGKSKANLMVTDAPYDVNYDPTWRGKALRDDAKRAEGKVAHDNRINWEEVWSLIPCNVAYVWHGGLHGAVVERSLLVAGFVLKAQIIWVKTRAALSRGNYHWQHEPCQPAGTLVDCVTRRGSGSQKAIITKVPIENLKAGDLVVSYNSYEGIVRKRGRTVQRIGSRPYSGNLHTIGVGELSTKGTAEHQFSVRFNPKGGNKYCLYLMRRNDRFRLGVLRLFNSRGFGPAVRLSQEEADGLWLLSVHDDALDARVAEQAASCIYGIPVTHWVVGNKPKGARNRSLAHIDQIYKKIGIDRIGVGARKLFSDYGLDERMPLVTPGFEGRFSRSQTRRIRALNLLPEIMQVPVPTVGDDFEWRSISEVSFRAFKGRVYSMDVEKDEHYVADGIVTHNCFYVQKPGKDDHWRFVEEHDVAAYSVREGHQHSWQGDRRQSTVWFIEHLKNDTGHGRQKPVECMRKPILNNSDRGEFILDPFIGSGTTIIACEMEGRKCLGVELDPQYVQVAIERWEAFVGKKAMLEGSDKTLEQVTRARRTGRAKAAA